MANKNEAIEITGPYGSNEECLPSAQPIAVAVAVVDDGHHSQNTTAQESNVVDGDDEEARALAEAAREEGIANIHHHCTQHLSQNPESSFVTWIATLHPENAQVFIDQRFLIEGNPWLTVYEEVKEDLQKSRATGNASSDNIALVSPCLLLLAPLNCQIMMAGGPRPRIISAEVVEDYSISSLETS